MTQLLRVSMLRGAMLALALVGTSFALSAQERAVASLTELRTDGNGISELRTTISLGFTGTTASALNAVAVAARLNLTFDATLPELSTTLSVRSHTRTAAVALIEIGQAAGLRMRLSPLGQIVIDARPKSMPLQATANRPAARTDTTNGLPVALAGIRIASERTELGRFKNDVSVTAFVASNKELRAVPTFVEPDVLRSVQTLPGVQSRSDWSAGFNVHGGEADQTAVLLDGFPVYNPFHAGGLFSAFIDPMVGGIELHSGALPARYGGRLSAVLDVKSAEPTSPDWNGSSTVSLVSSSATIGRAFADGNGGWIVGGRRTYLDLVVKALGQDLPYHFEDGSLRMTREIRGGVRVGLTAYGSKDDLGRPRLGQDGNGGWSNMLVGLSFAKTHANTMQLFHVAFDSIAADQRLSVSGFNASLVFHEFESGVTNTVRDWRATGSVAFHRTRTQTTFGYEAMSQRMLYNAASPIEGLQDIVPFDSLSQRNETISAFVEHVWRPTRSLVVNVGGRAERSTTEGGLGLSPRIALKYFVTPTTAISVGGGRVTQIQHSLGREEEIFQPLQFWVMSDSSRGASTVKDAVFGVEHWLTSSRMLHVGTYYKQYDRLLAPNRYSDADVNGDSFVTNTGTSCGADFMLRQLDGGKYSGWISYAFALGKRTDIFGRTIPPGQDRRHNFNLVGNLTKHHYAFGGRINIASGLPATPKLGEFVQGQYDPVTRRWNTAEPPVRTIDDRRNSARLPVYRRIDLSATRFGHIKGATTSTYLSIVNVLNLHNPAGYLYEFNSKVKRIALPNLPLLPTMGVRVEY